MNYLIGFIIFIEGVSIMIDPAPSINPFGIPKGFIDGAGSIIIDTPSIKIIKPIK